MQDGRGSAAGPPRGSNTVQQSSNATTALVDNLVRRWTRKPGHHDTNNSAPRILLAALILNRWARLHEAMRKWIYWFIQRLHTAGFMSVNVGISLKEAYARLPDQLTPHPHMVSCVRLVTTIMEITVMRLLRTWQARALGHAHAHALEAQHRARPPHRNTASEARQASRIATQAMLAATMVHNAHANTQQATTRDRQHNASTIWWSLVTLTSLVLLVHLVV